MYMKYNFDEVIDREDTNSIKWDPNVLEKMFGERELLPLWVADMDFKAPKIIIDAVVKRAEHGIYGYSTRTDSYYNSIINWTKKRFGWDIKKEWIKYTPGVVPAINYMIQTFCMPGDKVLIQEPVYYPFKKSIENNGCKTVINELKYNGEFYEINFKELEEQLKDLRVKMFILCSPHNPVSRVWTKEELIKIGDLCLENNVLLVSDEIHSDLVFSNNKHTMIASIKEEFAMNSITCTAPSKTFNFAGMQASNIIIPNEKLRNQFADTLERNNIELQNPFSLVAIEIAYNQCEDWLENLLKYLEGNIDFINEYLSKNLPKAKMIKPQATYLGWIDFNDYIKDGETLQKLMAHKAKVAMDGGTWFGKGGEGFMRINFACPRSILEEGLSRICKALNNM